VTVAATTITNSPTLFSNTTHLIDFHVDTPIVKAGDAWAGRHLGIQLLSTVNPLLVGGYWDLDNVRLTSIRETGAIPVPNGSFESPATNFVDIRIDAWEETPKPFWYDESGGFLWDQLTGVFANTAPTNENHIDNLDGNQAIFLFALPEVGLFQDYDSIDWSNSVPTHAFDVKFEVGYAYQLTVGVIGGGGGMTNGVTLELSLYYRDDASNRVTVAATPITNSPAIFSNTTHLIDFHVRVPLVNAGDAWAGRHVGIQLLSTVDPLLAGGYWDLDNVRLVSIPRGPVLTGPVLTNGQFQFAVQGAAGMAYEISATTNITLPRSGWTSLATLTNQTGSVTFTDAITNAPHRFYRARQVPDPAGAR
jgi:hypothetical protein